MDWGVTYGREATSGSLGESLPVVMSLPGSGGVTSGCEVTSGVWGSHFRGLGESLPVVMSLPVTQSLPVARSLPGSGEQLREMGHVTN